MVTKVGAILILPDLSLLEVCHRLREESVSLCLQVRLFSVLWSFGILTSGSFKFLHSGANALVVPVRRDNDSVYCSDMIVMTSPAALAIPWANILRLAVVDLSSFSARVYGRRFRGRLALEG